VTFSAAHRRVSASRSPVGKEALRDAAPKSVDRQRSVPRVELQTILESDERKDYFESRAGSSADDHESAHIDHFPKPKPKPNGPARTIRPLPSTR